jgi:hypothetical protein
VRYFRSDNILNSDDADKSVSSLLNFIEIVTFLDIVVVWATLRWLKVSVSERNGSQGLAGVDSDCLEEALLYAVS